MTTRHASGVWLLVSQGVQVAVQILSLITLSHLLAPRAFGLVAMVVAVIGLAGVLSDFGLSLSALVSGPLTNDERTNLFWANSAVGLLLTGVVAAVSPLLALAYGRPQLIGIGCALSVMFVLNAMAVQLKVELNVRSDWVRLGVTESVPQLVGFAVAVLIAALTHAYWAIVVQQVLAAAGQLALAAWFARWLPGRPAPNTSIRAHLRFGRDTVGLHALNYLGSNADSVLIGRSLGPSVLGQYNRAYALAVLPVNQIAGPLTRLALPRLSAVAPEQLDGELARYQRGLVYLQLAPLSLCVAIAGPLVHLALGSGWGVVPNLLRIQALGAAFSALGYVFYWAFLVKRRTALMALTEGCTEVLMVFAMVLLVSHGPAAVCWCVTAGQFAMLIGSAVVSRRSLRLDVRKLARVSGGPAVMFALAVIPPVLITGSAHQASAAVLSLGGAGLWLATVAAVGLTVPGVRADARSAYGSVSSRFAWTR